MTKPTNNRTPWTAAEDETIRAHYPTKGANAVAAMLGRSFRAVTLHAGKLGVRCGVSVQYIDRKTAKPTPAKVPATRRAMSGPFYADAVVELHPKFKLTQAPAPPQPTRTNTYSIL